MNKRLVVITNGNYFARLLLKGLTCDPSLVVVGIVIVTGGYKGYGAFRTLWDMFWRTTTPYFLYKVWTLGILAVVQQLLPWTILSVKGFAIDRKIPYLNVRVANSEEALAWVAALSPDLLISISSPQRIGGKMLAIPKIGGINIHSSLLPRYAGLAPFFWVLAGGEKITGITVHWMTEVFDAGNILLQKTLSINVGESAFSLFKRLANIGADVLYQGVRKACDGDEGEKQNLSNYTYHSLPKFQDYMRMRKHGHRLIRPGELMGSIWNEIRRVDDTRKDRQ